MLNRSRQLRALLFFGSVLVLASGLYFFTIGDPQQTKEFSLANMVPHHSFDPKWNVHPISEKEKSHIYSILNQKFYYIGYGHQIYVFFSEDNKYVLKIFKQHRYTVPRWIRYLVPSFLSYRTQKMKPKENALDRDFTSYQIAFDQLQEETALQFVHLNSQDDFHHNITLIDKSHNECRLDLHDFEFVLQDMAVLVCPTIDNYMAQGSTAAAKDAIDSLLNFLYVRCKKGIDDSNPHLESNFAFLDNKVVQIDVGRFSLKQPEKFPKIKDEFKDYLHKFPELEQYFDTQYRAYSEKYAQHLTAQLD